MLEIGRLNIKFNSMKFFTTVKTLVSKTGEIHFKRFAIIETNCFAIYIHRIYKADKDQFRHSHPWCFASVVIKGEYVEEIEENFGLDMTCVGFKTKKPFTFSFGDRSLFHRIHRVVKPTTTLFLTFGKKKMWYFKTGHNESVPFQKFIDNKENYI